MSDVVDIGAMPGAGAMPEKMYASVIRPERYGQPIDAFLTEITDIPRPGRGEVLVYVMAAGINFNNVWAATGAPADVIADRQRRGDPDRFHIGGSEGSGIVWAVGEGVTDVATGDHVVMSSSRWDESAADIRLGADPMTSSTQSVWGYERNYGSFAQFTVVAEYQCHPKPARLSWEEAACYMLTGATAYRMLCGWPPHAVGPGDVVLVWGAAGGVGSMALQITRALGGLPVAVVSDPAKSEYCMRLGAVGVIDRSDFDHWGQMPSFDDAAAMRAWGDSARRFGAAIWSIVGERRNPRIVVEHSGEATLPTSMLVCDSAGMVVICGGTSGYHGDIDLRYLWMRQKRLQGSHFANVPQCRAITALVDAGLVTPCLSRVVGFDEIGLAHQLLMGNAHLPGNMAALVGASGPGLGRTATV